MNLPKLSSGNRDGLDAYRLPGALNVREQDEWPGPHLDNRMHGPLLAVSQFGYVSLP